MAVPYARAPGRMKPAGSPHAASRARQGRSAITPERDAPGSGPTCSVPPRSFLADAYLADTLPSVRHFPAMPCVSWNVSMFDAIDEEIRDARDRVRRREQHARQRVTLIG